MAGERRIAGETLYAADLNQETGGDQIPDPRERQRPGAIGSDQDRDLRARSASSARVNSPMRTSCGESMQIAAKTVPKFSAGAELKKAVQ